MKKGVNIFKIIEFSLYGIALAISIFFMVFFKLENTSLFGVLYTVMALSFLEVVLLLVRVFYKDLIKSLTPYVHVSYLVVALICYYILKHVDYYESYRLLYWLLYGFLSILALTISIILNYKIKKNGANITPRK